MCKNSSDKEKLLDKYSKEIINGVEEYNASESNIMALSLSEKEYINIKSDSDVLIEKDKGVVANWKLSNANKKRVKKLLLLRRVLHDEEVNNVYNTILFNCICE